MMLEVFKDLNISRMISEIGSEFWIEHKLDNLFKERDSLYCLSGRTAIDLILQDILCRKKIRSVCMPAWCCDSMISPFLAHGVNVQFYNHDKVDGLDDIDVFYLTNYFGYENTLDFEKVRKIKDNGAIILYDRTHSFLIKDDKYQEVSDYSFASIRKWMGVVSGAVIDGLSLTPVLKDCLFIIEKETAMRDKFRFLMGDKSVRKEVFLASFVEFGHKLASDYCNYKMDDLSYTLYKLEDLQIMKKRRRNNALYIHQNLKGVEFMYELTKDAVPLFVPVLFGSKDQRDFVRRKLIDNQIYCPVHWPIPAQIPSEYKVNDIVDRELSLICDQRYGLPQIKREIETINELI